MGNQWTRWSPRVSLPLTVIGKWAGEGPCSLLSSCQWSEVALHLLRITACMGKVTLFGRRETLLAAVLPSLAQSTPQSKMYNVFITALDKKKQLFKQYIVTSANTLKKHIQLENVQDIPLLQRVKEGLKTAEWTYRAHKCLINKCVGSNDLWNWNEIISLNKNNSNSNQAVIRSGPIQGQMK